MVLVGPCCPPPATLQFITPLASHRATGSAVLMIVSTTSSLPVKLSPSLHLPHCLFTAVPMVRKSLIQQHMECTSPFRMHVCLALVRACQGSPVSLAGAGLHYTLPRIAGSSDIFISRVFEDIMDDTPNNRVSLPVYSR